MGKPPKLSIILPVYNREKYIKKAINSILEQDFINYELIVINDGSKDNTEKIVKHFNDTRIRYYYQKNKGEYATVNRGFRLAKGHYITIVHSDDFLTPKSLSVRVECLDLNPDIDIVHGDMRKTVMSGKLIKNYQAGDNRDGKEIFQGYCVKDLWAGQKTPLNYTTFMIRKRVIDKVGMMDETLRYGGDLDWMMRAMLKCTFKKVNRVLYIYQRHRNAISKIVERDGESTKELTRKIQLRYCSKLV